MTIPGFIVWITVNVIRQIILIIIGLGMLIPIYNIYLMRIQSHTFKDMAENLWDTFSTEYVVVEKTIERVTKTVLERK